MLFYPVFHPKLFILQDKKIDLPSLSRFAYFLVLLFGFHLLITFCLIATCFQMVILFKFFCYFKLTA